MYEVVHNPGSFIMGLALFYLLSLGGGTVTAVDLVQRSGWALWVQVLALVAAAKLLLIAQMVGRSVAAAGPERAAQLFYGPLQLAGQLVRPLHSAVDVVTSRVLHIRPEERTSEEELRTLVDAVEETQALEADEREMITSIFELSDREVREIMVPRMDVVAADESTPVVAIVDLLISTGHSRVPVFHGDLDHLTGMVHLRDLARAMREGRPEVPVGDLVRSLHVVPETKKIDELLREFQQARHQMAVVADEYGGTAGVVTIEDLLEEIVGEIHDEYDVEEERIQVISEREAVMDARVSIHDANEVLALNLDDDEADTIGGVVYERLAKVPSPGDVVDLGNSTIRVISTRGRTVQRVQVTLKQ
jgi:CBS domain containing-hemolysin-like protein